MALVLAAGWLLVRMPPSVSLPVVMGGSLGLTVWLLYPDAPAYSLLALAPFALEFTLGPLNGVKVHDVVIAVLGLTVASAVLTGLHRRDRFAERIVATLMVFWVALLIWSSVTYLYGAANQWLLSTPVKNAWYVYRQIVRVLLPFPLILLFLRDAQPAGRALDVTLVVHGGLALHAVMTAPQTKYVAVGPFETGNQLAGYLVPIVPFAAARLFLSGSWRTRLLALGVLLVILRAIWLTGSRGGLAAAVATFLPLVMIVPRRRFAAAVGVGLVVGLVGLLTQGDILNSPKLQRFLTLGHFENQETYKWRQEQWALFMDRLAEHPWMGTGSDVDRSLADLDRAQTPHNTYLGIAMRSGVPGLALWLAVLGLAALASIRGLLAPTAEGQARMLYVGVLGMILGLAVHGFGEATLLLPQVQFFFWVVLGFTLVQMQNDVGRELRETEDA